LYFVAVDGFVVVAAAAVAAVNFVDSVFGYLF
jgi:hypothetical protein